MELHRLRPARDLTLEDVTERSAYYSQLRRRAAERHGMPGPSAAIGGVSALALLAAATVPKLLGGGGASTPGAAAAPVAEAAATQALPHSSLEVAAAQASPTPTVSHPARSARPAVHRVAPHRSAAVEHTTPQPLHAARTTTSAPRAKIASVNPHTVPHASGGAGLASAPKQTVAKPRVAPVHHTPSVPARHTTTTSHKSGGAQVKSTGAHVKSTTTQRTTGVQTAPPVSSGGYVNPLAHASVTPERIDQGVDYSGSGTLTALGAGRVVTTSGSGWPGGFIEYRLTSGAYAGRYVYYAEGVSPVAGLHLGESVQPGQAIATMSGGIEIGWGSGLGSQPLAQAQGQWSGGSDSANVATPAGRSFSALIASLGGRPGKVEG